MFISISPEEKREKLQDEGMAKSILSLRQALKSNSAELIAQALHDYELPQRTETRFEYAIEWEMLGADKVDFWKQVRELYNQ
jgi:hypothetical protein